MPAPSLPRRAVRPTLAVSLWLCAAVSATGVLAQAAPVAGAHSYASGRGWTTELLVGAGLPDDLRLLGRAVDGAAAIGLLRLAYRGAVRGPVYYALGAEGFVARRSGNIEGASDYRATTARFGVDGRLGVALPGGRWTAAVGLAARNRVAPRAFELRRRDNLRFDLRASASYALRARLSAVATLGTAMRRRDDSDYVADPRHQLLAGLRWRLTKRARTP